MARNRKNKRNSSDLGSEVGPSELRRYFESIDDRDELARAIWLGGCWADEEIADLTARAATSMTIEGQLLHNQICEDQCTDGPTSASPTNPVSVVAAAGPSINYSDPFAVRHHICRNHPFGELLRPEGIVHACAQGHGEMLLRAMSPNYLMQFDLAPLEWE